MAADPEAGIRAELDRLAGALPGLGLAVSGGGDSTALLHVAVPWGRDRGIRIEAATVDHGLRAEAGAEAETVAQICTRLGVGHRILPWRHEGRPSGNLMDAARRARLSLLSAWAAGAGLGAVALGHTMDDQAETLLMRLGRGAGVDGLSGMAPARMQAGMLWLRPLLGQRRAALRDWLAARGAPWTDDPTNEDTGFDRIRIRRAIAALDLPVEALARSAAHLSDARAALAETAAALAAGAQADRGVLRLPPGVLAAPADLRRRIVTAGLRWVTGADYAPRGEDVARLIAALGQGGQGTLDGVIAAASASGEVEMIREPQAARRAAPAGPGLFAGLQAMAASESTVWDGRFRLSGLLAGAVVRCTAEADLAGRDWRASGLPRRALLSSPAVDLDGRVVLPLVQPEGGITAAPLRDAADYLAILRSH